LTSASRDRYSSRPARIGRPPTNAASVGTLTAADPSADAIRACLARVVASPAFAGSHKLIRFLTFVVEETLVGRGDQLKEYSIGVGALGRPADFDPASDSAVRVAARQLRFKLLEHFAEDGRDEPIVIALPKGGYVPTFSPRAVPGGAGVVAERRSPRRRARVAVLISLLVVVSATLGWLAPRLWAGIVRRSITPKAAPPPLLAASDRSDLPAIVVLPFLNLSGAPEEEYISDGLTEEITAALANVGNLRVVARTSAFRYKGKAEDVRAIAKGVDADVVLEGSVRRSGDTYRVTAQLAGGTDGVHLWAATYDEKARDLFTMYDAIAAAVTDAIQTKLGAPLDAARPRRTTTDPVAHALYLQGRFYWNRRTPDASQRSVALYEQAIARDSTYALAYAGIGDVYAAMAVNNQSLPGVAPPKAVAAARRALALDPSLGEPHATLGLMRAFADWDWTGADAEFARAIELSPNYATARAWYANVLLVRGRFDEAIEQFRQARLLDPLSVPIAYQSAEAYYYARRWTDALAGVQRILELDPANRFAHILRGNILVASHGSPDAARAAYREGADTLGAAVLLPAAERKAEIDRRVAALPKEIQEKQPYLIAILYGRIGAKDEAFTWLDRALATRNLNLVTLEVDPAMDSLRDDPRYAAIAGKLMLHAGR
jgi:TolB-like protein